MLRAQRSGTKTPPVAPLGCQHRPVKVSGPAISARPTSMNYRFRRGKYVLLMDNHHATHAFDANFRNFTTRPQERLRTWRRPSSPGISSCAKLGDLADGSSCRACTAPRYGAWFTSNLRLLRNPRRPPHPELLLRCWSKGGSFCCSVSSRAASCRREIGQV